ncbi:hypothetical protein HJB53_30030 [Rhizobium lentis]|uniref:hypothetical protein n=1 Tax=Rhizobium lentis TaxID=1138194 RepID=UPI001C8326C0|nr:hypothetical protein [Rhizobium lentis]MBX5130730.1 hypothetical protein [Rhizobium lentis]
MTKIRVAGAIATQSGVTVILQDGSKLNLKKDTERTAQILDQLIEKIRNNEVCEIDLGTYEVYASIEDKTNGAVKFVRGTLSRLKSLFGKPEEPAAVELTNLGSVRPSIPAQAAPPAPVAVAPVLMPAVDPSITSNGDLHAVVDGKVIPVDGLDRHIEAAANTENAIGLQRFLERIAKVIDGRTHTVKELMDFMRKGDLPIADDGCIVAYKVLKTGNGAFVDCHSGQVTQKLGSFVQMDEKLVDPNRRNECSTGLHIARRGYLRRFSGNIITLVKVAPEDVIAVPPGEPDKMRAKGYHIVGVLPSDVHATLRAGQPMTGHKIASKMLADVIKGNHVGVLEYVNIGAAMGGDVTITPADGKKLRKHERLISGEAQALPEETSAPAEKEKTVSIRELRKKVDEAYDARTKISQAAAIGDMSAALNTASAAPAKAEKPKKAAAKAKPVVEAVKKSAEADVKKIAPGAIAQLPQKHADAIRLHSEGKSNRAIEAELHICRKTLKKLFDKHGLKPNG